MGFAQPAGALSKTSEAKHRSEWAARRQVDCVRPRATVATFSEAEVDGRHGTRHFRGLRQQLAETTASMAFQQESMEEADESASWEHGCRDVQRRALERA
jgi:hypothetical protein